MRLSKPIKILVGLGTAWLTIYPFLFLEVWLTMVLGMVFMSGSSNDSQPFFLIPFFAIFPLHFLTIFLQFFLDVFYLIHVIKNTTASETLRIILGVGPFFLSFIAMPIYYYLYIWRDQPPDWAIAPVTQ
jgi:hypothetical protein